MENKINKFLTLLAVLLFGIGQMWAVDPVENVGTYSTQVISADGLTSTWTFITPGSQVTVPNAETEDVDVIYVPSGSSKMKFSSSNGFSWSGTSSGYFYVPSGAAGTISMTVKSSSDTRFLQLYVAGEAAAETKRLYSKLNSGGGISSDGKKGPQSFSFTSSDITTKGTKTYLHFKDNNTEMKIATISITLTTGTYLTPSCTKPGTPTSLAAESVTHNSASLSWTAGANNDGHKIYIEKKSDKTKVLDWTDATSPYAASGLDPETTYTFKVKAKGATGYCDLGDEASADFATDVDPSATTYKVTLVPAGGTISDATGWTYDNVSGNYTKEVSDGTELALPTFTKTNRTFKTWRKAGPTDVTSPITVTADVTLTAIWNATIETVLYSWEGGSSATEEGGTAETYIGNDKDGSNSAVNATSAATAASVTYKTIRLAKAADYSQEHVRISLDQNIQAGDKVRLTMFICKSSAASAAPKMDTQTGTAIFAETTNVENIYESGSPVTRTYTVPEGINTNAIKMTRNNGKTGSTVWIPKIQIIRESQVEESELKAVTFRYNDGSTPNNIVYVASGQKVAQPADPTWTHHRFNNWQLSGVAYNFSTPVTSDIALDATWTQLYTITFANGGGSGDAPSAIDDKAKDETFTVPANTFTAPTDKEFDTWNDGSADYAPGATYTVGTANVVLTAKWKAAATKYAISKGTHVNGDFSIDPAEQAEGSTVTLTATPNEDYVLSAWEVVKTEDASATGITVTNNTFTMPAYAVTVNATFAADPRQKVLYLTATEAETVKANDKLYAALKDIYNVKIAAPASQTLTDYALIVLHESIGGTSTADAVVGCKTTSVPVLNTKSYFYNDGRWGWGTPNGGKSVKGATLNSATYCNIADHPLFSGVTVTTGFFEITDDAAAKCMQPVGSFEEGYEGYTLATTPNADSGNGCAIHEIPAGTTARGASSGKYMMISVSSAKLDALNANGQKLFQNAAAYLIGSTAWDPIEVPTDPELTAVPTAAYSVGDDISLSAVAGGTSASTTYTWYKGDTWAEAEAAGAIQAAATAASGGDTYEKDDCVLGDAGTYWCVMYNGPECEAKASVVITVSDASYDIAFVSAHGTAPTATTGVSYILPELTASGWEHQGWTANIDVEVDDATVTSGTLIANGKTAVFAADVTFTAVWKQEFQVTYNLQGHGDPIAAQIVLDGGKVTEPSEPSEIGYDFGGWYKEAGCINAWNFASDVVTANTELFAKWTAFAGCALLYPALSGDAPTAKNQEIILQTGSAGGKIYTAGAKSDEYDKAFAYTSYGLGLQTGGADSLRVVLNYDMQVGTVIKVKIYAASATARGLYLQNLSKTTKMTMSQTEIGAKEYSYTVVAGDGLEGKNAFILARNNTVYLQYVKVESCGDEIIYHNLTYAVDPAAKGTVTLGAGTVREGRTTTATYSEIASGYEFDEWQISGTGASITDASANPAVITMGTTDAVVTLKLKVATPKHTVTFNKMGKGDDIASQSVKEGDLVEEPTVTEPEGWILEGWYKEEGLVNKWNFASDVMSTSDFTLYAKWVADPSIKLINKSTGAINTTNYTTAVAANANVDGEKGAAFSSARTALSSVSALGEMVQYNATTNQTKIQLSMYNTSTAQKTIYLFKLAEGAAAAESIEINIDGSSRLTTEYYTFNSNDNRSFYVTVSDVKVQILQVKVIDDGTALKQFGQSGYSLNFNKGRMFAKNDGSAYAFEGGSITVSSDYKVLNNSNLATKSYIQFNNAVANAILKVTRSGGSYYVSQDPNEKGTSYSKDEEIVLTSTGTWYLGSTSSGSAASFSKIEFIAPQCDEPTITPMSNSNLCEGDDFAPLTVSATVSDGGTLHYQWYKHPATGDDIAVGTDAASFTPESDGQYYVVVTNKLSDYSDNSATSNTITVEHFASAVITTAPLNQRGEVGNVVTLSVAATGKNVAYKWYTCDAEGGSEEALDPAQTGTSISVTITAGMSQWYKVKVTSDCGNTEAKAKVSEFVPATPADVTASTIWDWTSAVWPATGSVPFSSTAESAPYELLADADAIVPNNEGFRSDMLYGKGQYVWRSNNQFFQGTAIKFTTTVAGLVRVSFRSTSGGKIVSVSVNGTAAGSRENSFGWSKFVEVPSGDVEILCTGNGYTRIQKIEFVVPGCANVDVDGETNISTIENGANVTVKDGGTLIVDEVKTLNDLVVENGGKVALSSSKLTLVGTFAIQTIMAGGKSGQMIGATNSNIAASEAYIDITLGANADPEKWHAFTVPFPVHAINGVFDNIGNKLTNEVNYAIMSYHGDVRAEGLYGWKKYRDVMVPGTFYLMTVEGDVKTFRFKMVSGSDIVAPNSKSYTKYTGAGEDNDYGWNGLGNPTLKYGKVNFPVQVLDPSAYEYITKPANSTNFVVGTPFFYKAGSNGSMPMLDPDDGSSYAPSRERVIEIKDLEVSFGNEAYSDKLYISASEEALNEYEYDKDLVKMRMSNTPKVPQIIGKAYGYQLSMVNAPMSNDKAEYALSLYAPANGEYTIAAQQVENAEVYLTKDGSVIWNISESAYTAEFTKGSTESYGLLMIKKTPQVTTGIDGVESSKAAQKLIIDQNVFILRGEKMYDVTGKEVTASR